MDAKRKEIGELLIAKMGEVEENLRRRGIPPVDIPDHVQEVFRRAFEYLMIHGVAGDVGALLQKIGDDLASNYRDRAKTRTKHAPSLTEEDLAPTNPEKDLAEQEIHAQLHEAIGELPSPVREFFTWKFVDDLKNPEIAKILRVSVPTVERRVAEFTHLIEKALRRKGIDSPLVIPFDTEAHGDGAPSERTELRMALSRPASSPPPSRSFWHELGKLAGSAAVGGLLVWLFLRPPSPASHFSPLVHLSPAAVGFTPPVVAPHPLLEPPPCPVVAAPPSSPPEASQAPEEPKVDATPRHIARLCLAAMERGDEVERKRWCSKVTGAFRKAFEDRAARTP